MTSRTLNFIANGRPYNISKVIHPKDPFMENVLSKILDDDTLLKVQDWTRGMYSPELHYESLLRYDQSIKSVREHEQFLMNDPSFQAAIAHAFSTWKLQTKAEAIPMSNLDSVPYVHSSSAGHGYVGSKRSNYAKARRYATASLNIWREKPETFKYVPDKAFVRTQLAEMTSPKVRHVWGRAFHNILIEGTSAHPLLTSYLAPGSPLYAGSSIFRQLPSTILTMAEGDHTTYFCLDFKGFDFTVCPYLIDIAFDILESNIVFPDEATHSAFNYSREHMKNKTVIMPDGKIYSVTTGIPSGSYFTQLVGSIINSILCYWTQSKFIGKYCDTHVLGDDSIFATSVRNSYDSSTIAKFLLPSGMTLNSKIGKSIITDNILEVIFLGHKFYGTSLTRDEFTLVCLAMLPEFNVRSPAHSITRLQSLNVDCQFTSTLLYNALLRSHCIYGIKPDQEFHPVNDLPPYWKLYMF